MEAKKPKITLNPDKSVVEAIREGLKKKDGYPSYGSLSVPDPAHVPGYWMKSIR